MLRPRHRDGVPLSGRTGTNTWAGSHEESSRLVRSCGAAQKPAEFVW